MKQLIWFIVFSALLFLATHFGIGWVVREWHFEPFIAWFACGGAVFVAMFFTALCRVSREQRSWHPSVLYRALNFRRMSGRDWAWTLGGVVVVGVLSMLIMEAMTALSERFPEVIGGSFSPAFMTFRTIGAGEYWIYLAWLPFFLFNIFGEEILWRGCLLPRQGWMLNSFGWAIFHVAFGWKLVVLLLPILIVLPFVAHKTNNTWSGVIIHGLVNGSGFLLITLGVMAA